MQTNNVRKMGVENIRIHLKFIHDEDESQVVKCSHVILFVGGPSESDSSQPFPANTRVQAKKRGAINCELRRRRQSNRLAYLCFKTHLQKAIPDLPAHPTTHPTAPERHQSSRSVPPSHPSNTIFSIPRHLRITYQSTSYRLPKSRLPHDTQNSSTASLGRCCSIHSRPSIIPNLHRLRPSNIFNLRQPA